MTHKNNYSLIEDLAKQGLDAIPELVRIVINNAMQAEREPDQPQKFVHSES